MSLPAGRLRNRVTIKSKTATQNSYGEEVIVWVTLATVWAAVEPMRGQEYLESRRLQAEVDYRVRLRYRSGLAPTMRVYYDNRTLEVVSVLNVNENHRETHLMCKELL